ncbi:MAG: Rieske 2Fe-2S domain-containing protein [Acidobacteria bacterium]|nr:Rieske 2Fe-2S domain-containing protein [Acidobacteriota bacterium]
MGNPAEVWKAEKHGFDVWPDVVRHAAAGTPMSDIATPDLERMKWYGFFYRKHDAPGRYMNRIRITAGELTADQAQAIALMAYELGHGIVDVTTRANLQVQGLAVTHLPVVEDRLAAVGLTGRQTGHDNVRNVFAHPFSGLLPDEVIDTRELCHAVTALFIGNRDYADLPRKINICLNGTTEPSAHFWTQDLSFLACRVEGEVFFQLLVGGTQGQNPHLAWHVPVLVRPAQVVPVTGAVLDLFREQGSREDRHRARLRYLVERIGVSGVEAAIQERVPLRRAPDMPPPMPAGRNDDLVGWFPQRDPDLWTMGLCVPLGRLSWRQLEAAGVIAKRWGDGRLRTTHEQGLAIVNIPTGFKDAAATDAAAVGLSVHADSLSLNTMACTGTQFCNIAVTETKGAMFRLIDTLRRRTLMLHGIRIHMSGCPSSCAQHFTADIGLKGVRVRRLIGAREGFDMYLGGGVSGDIHMGLPYRLGVDAEQLPLVIEEVVHQYYLKHRSGQTFSAYWRERLQQAEAAKVGESDYRPSTWICERCDHQHLGEDPPVFCPGCAGVRRLFARVDVDAPSVASVVADTGTTSPPRAGGFVCVAADSAVVEGTVTAATVDGQSYALCRVDGEVQALDGVCPHEGGPLGEGALANGAITCPWHGWSFNVRTGCGIEPAGLDCTRYETRIENQKIYLKPSPLGMVTAAHGDAPSATATLTLLAVRDEAPGVRTFQFDNHTDEIPHARPGTFAQVCVSIDGVDTWRSFTVSSAPATAGALELRIKRNPGGAVSNALFETIRPGSRVRIRGTHGGFFFDPERHREPLVLISAGSGVTPMMSIARYLAAHRPQHPCTFIHGARTAADIIFRRECQDLHDRLPSFTYYVTLSRPDATWDQGCGRVDPRYVADVVKAVPANRYFLCGPAGFMDTLRAWLSESGVPDDRVHTEQFLTAPIPGSMG